MRKVGVVADTAATIPSDLVKKYDIRLVPLQAIFTDRTYRDGIDLKTPDELFQLVEKSDKYPTSSAPAPDDYLETYRQLSREGKSILCVTISSGLSMAFKSATVAKEMAQKELPGVKVELFDSRETVGGLGMITMAVARAAASGKNLEQVIKAASEVKDKLSCIVLFDTLSFLAKSGRIGRATALMGDMLSIKPIVEISTSSGRVEPVTRVRTKPKAVKQLLEVVKQRVGTEKPIHIMVEHTAVPEEAAQLKEMVSAQFNCAELLLCEFNPTGAVTIGPGNLGLSFYSD